MKAMTRGVWVFMVGVLIAAPAAADYECPTGEKDANVLFDKGAALVNAGQDAAGFALLKQVEAICFEGGDRNAKRARFEGMIESVGRKLAKTAEASGKFDEAERIYVDIRNASGAYTEADEDRVTMARARAKASALNVVSSALYRFDPERRRMWAEADQRDRAKPHQAQRAQQMAAYETELRAMAAAQGDAALAAEAAAFVSPAANFGNYPLDDLDRAKSWFELADASAMKRAIDRGITRGDKLTADDTVIRIAAGIDYYERAGATAKIQQARASAKQLGDAADKAGNYQKAAEFYNVAGLDELADSVLARGEAQSKAAEKKRKAEFDAGTDDLEKELGF